MSGQSQRRRHKPALANHPIPFLQHTAASEAGTLKPQAAYLPNSSPAAQQLAACVGGWAAINFQQAGSTGRWPYLQYLLRLVDGQLRPLHNTLQRPVCTKQVGR